MANVFIVAPESLASLFEGTPNIKKDALRYDVYTLLFPVTSLEIVKPSFKKKKNMLSSLVSGSFSSERISSLLRLHLGLAASCQKHRFNYYTETDIIGTQVV